MRRVELFPISESREKEERRNQNLRLAGPPSLCGEISKEEDALIGPKIVLPYVFISLLLFLCI